MVNDTVLAYADRKYELLKSNLADDVDFSRIVGSNSRVYILSGFFGAKKCDLVYSLIPYDDKSGGDASMQSPQVSAFDLRFEQEPTAEALNEATDTAFTYFDAAARGIMKILTYKLLFMTHRDIQIEEDDQVGNSRDSLIKKISKLTEVEQFDIHSSQ